MKTKEEAEAKLAKVGLLRPVAVADVTDPERGARRAYQFDNEDKSQTIVEIDADPSPRQVADLASNLPVPEDKRMAALAIMAQTAPVESVDVSTKVALGAAALTGLYEIANSLGLFN